MHERDLNVTTTYPFKCMIFSLWRSAGVPSWYIDHFKTLLGTVYISLIMDEANELGPHRGPHKELPLLCENRGDTVANARTAAQVDS